jgi:tetratricopeptide (TPR) repeat protein
VDERIERARLLCERAVFGGDAGVLSAAERELDAVEADLAVARGRILHARSFDSQDEDTRELALFERATQLYRRLGDLRGEGESSFWIGCFHQVVRGDNEAAVPALERSFELATQAGDTLTQSYALRHLGIAEHAAGRLDTARERLEESVRLRKEIGFFAGVAANLVGLIYIAVAQDRRSEAQALLEEARALAEACGANRIMRQVDEARAQIEAPSDLSG